MKIKGDSLFLVRIFKKKNMKHLSLLLIFIFGGSVFGQNQDFKMEFKLRFENQKVYCDVIPKEDYEVMALQFGINHNSDHVVFDTLTSDILTKVNRKIFNEICPKNVRIVWTASDSKNRLLKKDIPFLTLEYREIIASDHYICLMPSQSPSCSTMYREIIFENNNDFKLYNIPDVCVEYKIKDGVIFVATEDQKKEDHLNLVYKGSEQALRILGSENDMLPMRLMVFDLFGHTIVDQFILNVNELISIPQIRSGLYAYVIQKNTLQQHSGVIPIFSIY